jgi:undecaprenyl-diphosphatase
VALAIEVGLLLVLRDGEIFGWEQSLTRTLQDVPGKGLVFDVTSTLTNTLSAPFILIFATIAGLVVMSGHRWAALMLLLSFPLHVLAQFPKALVDRPRPSLLFDGIEGVGGSQSFPSGHAEYVVTFYGFLAYLLVLHARTQAQRAAIVVAWGIFALATGFGRIAEGRHWPLDVLASYVVGFGLLAGLIWLYRALRLADAEG